ncbi:MAG: MATE family efflux transporter [Gammaproteobacteria bacterium]|nr:MATE family efflux transporter [Gammaproteobacteria bacterium]
MDVSAVKNKAFGVFKNRPRFLKVIFIFSIPIVLSRILIALRGIISTLFIAQFGHTQFAASTLINASLSPILIILMTFLYPISVLVGNARGVGNTARIKQIVHQGWILGALVGIIAFFLLPKLSFIFLFFRQPKQLIHYVGEYIYIMKWSILPLMLSGGCQQFFLAVSKASWVTVCHCFNFVLLIMFSYIFSFTQLGMQGIAYANVLTDWMILFIQLMYIFLNSDIKKFKLFHFCAFVDIPVLRQITQMGLPISIQFGTEWMVLSLLTFLIGTFGETALIAQQITLQASLVTMMIPLGISQACGILISKARGSGEYDDLNSIAHSGLILGSIFSLIVAYIYVVHSKLIVGLYLDVSLEMNASIIHLTNLMFVITAISQWFDSARHILIGVLRGYFDTRASMWIGIIMSCFISLPSGYFLGFTLGFGAVGVKAGLLCGFALGMMGLIYRLQRLKIKPSYVVTSVSV